MTIRIGSFCSGYRGLDQAVEEVFGGTTAWVSDIDPGANKILAHHWPTTPNIGDLRFVHWARALRQYGPVDVVCGGYPCQPFSNAGLRKGTDDARHIWPFIARALGILRPRVAIFENVAGHLRLGFDTVLCDLADLGFDVEWCLVRADEVGAPHQRKRLILLATASDAPREGLAREGLRGLAAERRGSAADADGFGGERDGSAGQPSERHAAGAGGAAAHAEGERLEGHQDFTACEGSVRRRADADRRGTAVADTQGLGRREGRPEPAWIEGRLGAAIGGRAAPADTDGGRRGPDQPDVSAGQPDFDWGRLAPAITRWEAATGHRAPWATDDRRRLSPAFVEWMMGLPAGHVTDVPGLTRTQQLRALGNGVVPQQAAAALRLLAARTPNGLGVAA